MRSRQPGSSHLTGCHNDKPVPSPTKKRSFTAVNGLVRMPPRICKLLLDGLLTAGSSPTVQLHILVEVNARSHAQRPLLAIVVQEELHALPPAMLDPVVTLRDASAALLVRILQRGVADGCFDMLDLATAAAIGAMGVRIPLWFHPSADLSIDTMAHQQALLALRMVGVTSSKAPR